jgi:hypothetical protein
VEKSALAWSLAAYEWAAHEEDWIALALERLSSSALQERIGPNPAEPKPRGLPGLQAPDPGLQEKQFLEPGVWGLESLPSCVRLRPEGTIVRAGRRA